MKTGGDRCRQVETGGDSIDSIDRLRQRSSLVSLEVTTRKEKKRKQGKKGHLLTTANLQIFLHFLHPHSESPEIIAHDKHFYGHKIVVIGHVSNG